MLSNNLSLQLRRSTTVSKHGVDTLLFWASSGYYKNTCRNSPKCICLVENKASRMSTDDCRNNWSLLND